MVELKNRQQWETEGKLQFHSRLTLMAQVLVPCWIQFYLPSCFQTTWACNKDTVLLYSLQYCTVK